MRRLCYCSSGEMKNVFLVLRSENGVVLYASLSAHRMDLTSCPQSGFYFDSYFLLFIFSLFILFYTRFIFS
ncbi:hypothetical protein VNO80_11325 [Phaseolus coccineus]|uniref:Uncharacterized protein n=1 Tax=Phaseolus coccineus TaxID=3886 RepID=A0AAN9RFE7_PHACN